MTKLPTISTVRPTTINRPSAISAAIERAGRPAARRSPPAPAVARATGSHRGKAGRAGTSAPQTHVIRPSSGSSVPDCAPAGSSADWGPLQPAEPAAPRRRDRAGRATRSAQRAGPRVPLRLAAHVRRLAPPLAGSIIGSERTYAVICHSSPPGSSPSSTADAGVSVRDVRVDVVEPVAVPPSRGHRGRATAARDP